MRSPFPKLLNKIMVEENMQELRNFFEPQQVVLSRGGAAKLVHGVRLSMEVELLHQEQVAGRVGAGTEEKVCVKIDIENAFNCCSRSATVRTLDGEDTLQHLAWAAACQLAPHFALESGGVSSRSFLLRSHPAFLKGAGYGPCSCRRNS